MKNKILIIHAEWLKNNGYKKEYKDCVKQITVRIMTGDKQN
jgi:hypothetical protein